MPPAVYIQSLRLPSLGSWPWNRLGQERPAHSGHAAGTPGRKVIVAEAMRERSWLGEAFQTAVTLAAGWPDTVQDAQLKLNSRSTTNTG